MRNALTWLTCTTTTLSQYERRTRVHQILIPTSIHHHGSLLDFPTRKQSKALTLILKFLEYPFELSNNQVKVSKYSITADTAIRIDHYPAGVYSFTHVSSLTAHDSTSF